MPRPLRCVVWTALVLAWTLPAALGVADEAPTPPAAEAKGALPPDGAWARYHVTQKWGGRNEQIIHLTIAFTGTEIHDGAKCRWIEFRQKIDGREEAVIARALVPERHLLDSANPFDHALKYQSGNSKGEFSESTETRKAGSYWGFSFFLPGVLKHARPLDEARLLQLQSGNFPISSGVSGRVAFRRLPVEDGVTIEQYWDYSVWMHPKASFGFARAEAKYTQTALTSKGEVLDSSSSTCEYALEDTGTDAKPSF